MATPIVLIVIGVLSAPVMKNWFSRRLRPQAYGNPVAR
jgi:hypothetical protein